MQNPVDDPGWFSEISDMWQDCVLSIKIEKEIYNKKSRFQDIKLYDTTTCGKMLVLDGMIQFTEADEFAYQEMLAHVPMFCHPNPERVLVIGGGDGGVVRELIKHDSVKEIDLCEIDEDVISVCRKYVPSLSCGFDDPRVNVHIADGSEFVRNRPNYYDVIIVDSSDPIGPGEALFGEKFYRSMKLALNQGGVIGSQGESFFLHQDVFCNLMKIVHDIFSYYSYSYMLVPTYPGGNLGVCCAGVDHAVDKPVRRPSDAMQEKLRYYTPELHLASTVLPAFGRKLLDQVRNA